MIILTTLDEKLRSIGLSLEWDFRKRFPGAKRDDGWSALGKFQQEVDDRAQMFEELGNMLLIPPALSDKTLLDFGCGLAPSANALAPHMQLTVGLDASSAHCVSAAECVDYLQLKNVAVLNGSLLAFPEYETIPFKASSFDMVISHHGFWRKDIPRLLPDLAGLLKRQGYLYLIYPRFWFATCDLTDGEQELRDHMEQRASNWAWVSLESMQQLTETCGLSLAYHGSLLSLPMQQSTCIIFVSSGIIRNKAEFMELIGDFDRRWLISQEIMVLQRR